MKNRNNLKGNSRCWFCLTAAGLLAQLQSRHSNRRWQQFEVTAWTAYFCSHLAVCVASNLRPFSLQILINYKNAEVDFRKLSLSPPLSSSVFTVRTRLFAFSHYINFQTVTGADEAAETQRETDTLHPTWSTERLKCESKAQRNHTTQKVSATEEKHHL